MASKKTQSYRWNQQNIEDIMIGESCQSGAWDQIAGVEAIRTSREQGWPWWLFTIPEVQPMLRAGFRNSRSVGILDQTILCWGWRALF